MGNPHYPNQPVHISFKAAVNQVLGDYLEERLRRVMEIATSFPAASAAGTSGLRPAHLAEMLRDDDGGSLLRYLERLTNTALHGDHYPAIVLHLCSARLLPLKKKNGNSKPVALGDTLRRVIEKVALALAPTKELMHLMLPLQTGRSGSAMCEHVAFSLQAI